MKVLVTGVAGQLGYDVVHELLERGHKCVGSDLSDKYGDFQSKRYTEAEMPYIKMDITDPDAVDKAILEIKPDGVIHCAAWTAVDLAEDSDNYVKVYAVNVTGTANIAKVCKVIGCKLLYISTDYVFDGQWTDPWEPDCKDFKP